MDYVTRGVCGQEGCRERRYYLDNGLWYCRRGHLQEGIQVAEDGDDFGNLGKVHRVKKDIKEKETKTLHGRPAWTLFLQIYQFILWKQCHTLIHEQGFPEELEVVVRDLWALRLPDYKRKITSTDADEDDDTESEVFSSHAAQSDDSESSFKPNSRYVEWPRLLDAVTLCYLAALLMRVPITVNDFYDMMINQQIPFTRVLATVPREMRERLPPELTGIFEVNKLPTVGKFHHGVQSLCLFYQRRFQMVLPPLNWPMILFRHIKRLGLPIEIYDTVKTLQSLLDFSFDFPRPKATIERKKAQHYPDVQLIVLIIIATKLHYPFDDLKRYPGSNKEPAALTMDWTRWEQAQISFNHDSHFGKNIEKEAAILVKDKDVMHMSTDQLDHYMDWYADNWLDSSREPGRLADMFSIQRAGDSLPDSTAVPGPPSTSAVTPSTPQDKIETMLYKAMHDIRPRRVIPEEDEEPTRPGEIYRRYRWESQLSGAARTFYEIAARLAAVPLKTLVRAVTLAEYRIAKDDERRQHREYFENQGVAVDESDDDKDYVMDEGGSDEEDNED